MPDVRTYPDASTLARAAAEHFVALAQEAVSTHGRFAVALAGGSTPRATYALLATSEFASRVDWTRVHIFWGDERCVPPDHPDSNYRTAREALLDHIPVPPDHVHRIQGEMEPALAAAAYERMLQVFFAPGQPRFDLFCWAWATMGIRRRSFPARRRFTSKRVGSWGIT